MKKLLITLLTIVVTHGAYATAGDDNATSKLYVDTTVATRQDSVDANDANTVMTYTDTAGTVGTKGIYDSTGSYAEQQNALVSADVANAAIMNAINMEFECAEWNPNTEIPETDCWKWRIHNVVNPSKNLFDISRVTNNARVTNNGDGSLTVRSVATDSNAYLSQALSTLAPSLVAGHTYVLSYDENETTIKKFWFSGIPQNQRYWTNKQAKTITQEMLNTTVYIDMGAVSTSSTIFNIQIEEGTTATPYQPYGQNTYLPQNQQ